MLKIKLGGKEVEVPQRWEEVTFSRFRKFIDLAKSFKTEEELEEEFMEEEKDMKELHKTLANLQSNSKMVAYWTGMTEDEVALCDVDAVGEVIKDLAFITEAYVPMNLKSFKFKGEEYFMPNPELKKETFGTYIEAEQVEINSQMLKRGKIDALTRQVAILCKKEGEETVSESEIDKRVELFEELDMATLWDVGFFLTKLESLLITNFLTLANQEETIKQKLLQKEQ